MMNVFHISTGRPLYRLEGILVRRWTAGQHGRHKLAFFRGPYLGGRRRRAAVP